MTDFTDAEFVDQCEITLKHLIPLGEHSRLRLFRLAGHTEEPPNYVIAWPPMWEMIDEARKRIANREVPTMTLIIELRYDAAARYPDDVKAQNDWIDRQLKIRMGAPP
jgi:hypothetical protein